MNGCRYPGPEGCSAHPPAVGHSSLNPGCFEERGPAGICNTSNADPRYYEEVEPGTREFVEDKDDNVRILVERQKNGLYHWLIETLDGNQMCEGVYDPETRFTAEICEDKTSKAAMKALEETVVEMKKPPKSPPTQRPKAPSAVIPKAKPKVPVVPKAKPKAPVVKEERIEIIFIQKGDWLSKIAQKLWGDMYAWKVRLKPTTDTLQRRKEMGMGYHPDRIYPGDKFRVL